jgi:hypothetical protein
MPNMIAAPTVSNDAVSQFRINSTLSDGQIDDDLFELGIDASLISA